MKHRALATALIAEGHIRLNRTRVEKPGHAIKEGDVLTMALHGQVRVVKVLGAAERRGSAPEARLLYEDLMPQQNAPSESKEVRA